MKTYMAKPSDVAASQWYLFDADDQVLGRLATKIATILIGKHRPEYTPHMDLGDHVIVVNAKSVRTNGANKAKQKMYQRYTGYTGGLKETSLERMSESNPEKVIKEAVRRMLPKSILGKNMIKKLKVYAGAEHKNHAQKPQKVTL